MKLPLSILALCFGVIAALPASAETLLADFEGADYGSWTTTGSAFGSGPPRGTLPNQHAVTGYLGQGLVNSFQSGDETTGTLTSPKFSIENHYISFLVGGGRHPGETEIQLLVNSKVVRRATGADAEQLLWHNWDVKELRGSEAQIRIVDNATGGWGHINVDNILLTDVKRSKVDPAQLDKYRKSEHYYREPPSPSIPLHSRNQLDERRQWSGVLQG